MTTTRASAETIEVELRGRALIESPLLNKDSAFTHEERSELGLLGFLPPHVETIEDQVARRYQSYSAKTTDLDKHIHLRHLQDTNETLFYRLLLEHIEEMTPIVYTPVVGQACQQFSSIYRRPRGVFISYPNRDSIDEILDNVRRDIKVIVATDAERILGLGDQGAGGMGIPIGKLSLYTLCGGIHPARTLPVLLDVGTNNRELLDDPLYIGWRHERITGEKYDEFIDRFVTAVSNRFPDVLLQWEDFATRQAGRILARYRDRICSFNDDIQGTAAVTTGAVLAAIEAVGSTVTEQRAVMLGAGSAGIGVTEQLVLVMTRAGLDEEEARSRFFMLDSRGLIHDGRQDLADYKKPFAQKAAALRDWSGFDLPDVVRNARPTILIAATGHPGVITEQIAREMARHTDHPIIFPLSNPTSRAEAVPDDLIRWTNGHALVATGSPFAPVEVEGRRHVIAQCNNVYVFPAMGLGILASGARRVTDEMFMAAALALKGTAPALADPHASLLPPLTDVRRVARIIALAVATEAQDQGVVDPIPRDELERRIDRTMWYPAYQRYTCASAP